MTCLRLLILVCCITTASCGGGASDAPARLWECNSAESGDWLDNGVLRHSDPTPLQRLTAIQPAVRNVDRCINGLQMRELLAGGPVAMSVPPGLPVVSLAQQLAADPSPRVVLALGEVEALFVPGYSLADHYNDLSAAVRIVRAAGKTPEIAGLIRFAPSSLITAEMIRRRDQFDAARRTLARMEGLLFYDLGAVPFYGAADVRPDLLHPNEAYQQRLMEAVATTQGAARVPAY